jgi:hypothetical protein
VHLFRDRKLSPGTIQIRSAAPRRPYLLDDLVLAPGQSPAQPQSCTSFDKVSGKLRIFMLLS